MSKNIESIIIATSLDELSRKEVKEELKQLFLELIGENEIRPSEGPKKYGIEQGLRRTRNKLRDELRQKVKSL